MTTEPNNKLDQIKRWFLSKWIFAIISMVFVLYLGVTNIIDATVKNKENLYGDGGLLNSDERSLCRIEVLRIDSNWYKNDRSEVQHNAEHRRFTHLPFVPHWFFDSKEYFFLRNCHQIGVGDNCITRDPLVEIVLKNDDNGNVLVTDVGFIINESVNLVYGKGGESSHTYIRTIKSFADYAIEVPRPKSIVHYREANREFEHWTPIDTVVYASDKSSLQSGWGGLPLESNYELPDPILVEKGYPFRYSISMEKFFKLPNNVQVQFYAIVDGEKYFSEKYHFSNSGDIYDSLDFIIQETPTLEASILNKVSTELVNRQIKPNGYSASSVLGSKSNMYISSNIADGRLETAWVEGADGFGKGEFIEFTISGMRKTFDKFIFYNGYHKGENFWKANNRAKTLKLYINDFPLYKIQLKDTMAPQIIDLKEYYDIYTDEEDLIVRLEIFEVYKGEKYNDTVLSEIIFTK